jgi:hypothetical protein
LLWIAVGTEGQTAVKEKKFYWPVPTYRTFGITGLTFGADLKKKE